MSSHLRIRLLLGLGLALIAAALAISALTQRAVARSAFAESDAAQQRLIGVLDQEDGVQDYLKGRVAKGRATVRSGRASVEREIARIALDHQGHDGHERELLQREVTAALRWQRAADEVLSNASDARPLVASAREGLLAEFRAANAATMLELAEEREAGQQRATTVSVGALLALVLVLGMPAYLLFERSSRRASRRGAQHDRFADALQFARTQDDAYDVLRRHLDITLANGHSVILNRNNSADRLEARTPVAPGTSIASGLEGAAPDACLAVRRGRTYVRRAGEPVLLTCDICGASETDVTCEPSLVGGEVIGSVLVEHDHAPSREDAALLRTAVAEAAPIVANLRNLELAERRAMTDTLTGLPNKRALDETLKRMVAQSDRSGEPLAAILFDLDHFKLINDRLGHEAGDEVLAAVGVAVPQALRAADVVGRFGGEEFLALLPTTSRDGAIEVAEKLRATIADAHILGSDRRVTASFGVAVLPHEARDGAELLRTADRALYTAKALGRDRVEVASVGASPGPLA